LLKAIAIVLGRYCAATSLLLLQLFNFSFKLLNPPVMILELSYYCGSCRYDIIIIMTLFNLRAIASDIEHEFFEMSLRLNSVDVIIIVGTAVANDNSSIMNSML
jgi:hypothetical protein